MKVHKLKKNGLQARAGVRTFWVLPFPAEAEIRALVVKQNGGNPVSAFTLDIFDSKRVMEASQSSGGAEEDGNYSSDPDLHRVCDTFAVTGSKLQRYYTDGGGIPYSNEDGGSSNKERKIYLEIEIPAGTDDTTWDVAIRAVTDVG